MNRALSLIGLALTVIYGLIVSWLIWGRIGSLQTMGLNEVGDFLAGVFGPVAILWLILGYFQQGMELRQNNQALILQAQELQNSVNQQKELVGVSREQLDLQLFVMKEEKQRLQSGRLPSIKMAGVLSSITPLGVECLITIWNIGFKAEDFAITIHETNKTHVWLRLPFLEDKFQKSFFLNVNDRLTEVEVSYKDGLSDTHNIRYKLDFKHVPDSLPDVLITPLKSQAATS